jgi:hypothetical protein
MITNGDAATFIRNGIDANMAYWKSLVPVQYNINLDVPASYYTQTTVAYTGTSTEKLR